MKKIIYILIAIVIVLVLAGIFKFDILPNFSGYDVDGNKITNTDKKIVKNFDDCVKAGGEVDEKYPNECLYQGDMVFVKKENKKKNNLEERLKKIGGVIEKNEQGQDELVFNDFPIRPIKSLNVDERNDFMNAVLAAVNNDPKPEKIMKAFPGIKKDDFENTGNLETSIDFQILLNNILERERLEPRNGEDLSYVIEDLRKGEEK